MSIDARTQIIQALGTNSNAHAVARQIGDISHVTVWQIAKDERIELAAGKAKAKSGNPGISPELRTRIIEALRGSNASPRLIARRLGNVSHVTVWKIAKELRAGESVVRARRNRPRRRRDFPTRHLERRMSVDNEHAESMIEKIKDMFNNAVGLPPGKFPDGETKPEKETDAPSGTLTSQDAEGLPPHSGTGIAVE